MTDLRPLLESSDDELERALLGSARSDLPRPLGLRETALALGLAIPSANALAAALPTTSALGASSSTALSSAVTGGAATGGASGVVGKVGAVSFGALGKSLLGGALVSFVALTSYDHTLGARSRRTEPTAAVTSPAAAVQAQGASVQPAAPALPDVPPQQSEAAAAQAPLSPPGSRRAAAPVAELVPSQDAPPRVDAPANAAFAPEAQPASGPTSASASLAAEIRLLDQARAALGAGDSNRASQLLDAYAASRHSTTLAQEAALLRVRLLLARGQRPAAAALARRIIAEHPKSAHVDSLRSLAAEP